MWWWRNYRPSVKDRLKNQLRGVSNREPAHRLCEYLRVRAGRPLQRTSRFSIRSRRGWAGLMWITGFPGQGPLRVGVPIADLASGMYTAIGVLIALLQREETGEGQWVHSSLLEAQIAMLDFQAARWDHRQRGARSSSQRSPHQHSDRRVFRRPTATSISQRAVGTMWNRLCELLGADETSGTTPTMRTTTHGHGIGLR